MGIPKFNPKPTETRLNPDPQWELRHNDKVMLVTGNPHTGQIHKQVWSFYNLRIGSPERQNRTAEFNRYVEALKGQGVQVHVVSILDWWRFDSAFPAYFYKKWGLRP